MISNIEQRCKDLGLYIIENKSTVRATARKFGISKSTVHKDLTERLPIYAPELYNKVRQHLEKNRVERHIRGGEATRRKYQRLSSLK